MNLEADLATLSTTDGVDARLNGPGSVNLVLPLAAVDFHGTTVAPVIVVDGEVGTAVS